MWRNVRIAILLFIMALAAYSNWYDRLQTTDWDETLWIGVFPINAAGDSATASYISSLTVDRVSDIEEFINREARRHGVGIERPVRIELYPEVKERPPERGAGLLGTISWSLKMRFYARRNSRAPGRPPPTIRIFVQYHDPSFTQTVPHSVGLQKGLVGVVHAFADRSLAPTNNVVIAHEILHTLGASDKYDPATLAPLYPIGYAEPDLEPRYPQRLTEIMAGRYATGPRSFEMPESLTDVRVGNATALEIRWKKSL
ncbi:MAG: hypothetical protein H7Y89_17350 [Steroidobacteraceae bacterium]|nr:hypothetical protein [Steroidobacteraceae bacterium]